MNQTDVRTFKAASMQEALEIVRREMGPDAVILQTREIPVPRFLKWRKKSKRVEVTAGTGVNVRTPRALRQPAGGRSAQAPPPSASHKRPVDRQNEESLAPPPPLLGPAGAGHQSRFSDPARGPSSAAGPGAYRLGPVSNGAPANFQAPFPGPAPTEQQTAIARQLSSIQEMVAKLTRESLQKAEDIPGELFQLYAELIDVEVEEELARDLIHNLKQNVTAGKLADAAASKARLRAMVEEEIRCAPPIVATPGRRRVVALVGPTGVGKTTTIAKLAANFRLRDGIRMGLVTVDTYRIAAVEQLRTYAEIIDLPMKVVTSPREMRRALDELSGLDLVLIDTAGRSPRDELKIQELKSLLSEAQVDEVHLVLSLVASPKSLQATAEKFVPAGTTAMILTKLDEAVGMGSLLSVSRRVPLPVSYLTTGQDVPDDIEHASARRVARLVLGEESLFARRKAS
ncbi:MAG: flagellar biosynthesis protein FlhF [Deltaproteobacteria bacterium]